MVNILFEWWLYVLYLVIFFNNVYFFFFRELLFISIRFVNNYFSYVVYFIFVF